MEEPNWRGLTMRLHMMSLQDLFEFARQYTPDVIEESTGRVNLIDLIIFELQDIWVFDGEVGKAFVRRVFERKGIK